MHRDLFNKRVSLGMLALCVLLWLTWCVPGQADSAKAQQDASPRGRFERAPTALAEGRLGFAASDEGHAHPGRPPAAVRMNADGRGAERHLEARTGDELAVLYASAAFYGLGTGGVVALQFEPQTLGGALLPFAIIGPAAIGGVALADSYRLFAHGMPHAIAAGLHLGLGEGLWVASYEHAYAVRHADVQAWRSKRVAAVVWTGSTLGAVAGALLGAIRRPTPGRVSFSASASIWAGALSAFVASALEPKGKRRAQTAFLIGGIGYNVGLLSGILFGPGIAPSVARMRFVDLGGLAGALLGAGGHALAVRTNDSRGILATAAVAGTIGLALSWWATSGMPPDHSHDALPPLFSHSARQLRPSVIPLPGGASAGITGRL